MRQFLLLLLLLFWLHEAGGSEPRYLPKRGRAMHTYQDGGAYDGGWKDGMRHGKGEMTFADGNLYDGHWQKDKWHGRGMYCTLVGNSALWDFPNGIAADAFGNIAVFDCV
jgi:hypothetical protein